MQDFYLRHKYKAKIYRYSLLRDSPLGTILVSGGLIFVAAYLGKIDLLHHDVTDPPIMECGLLFLGLTGLFTVWKGVTKRPYTFAALVFGLIFTALASGAWAWTEVLYSQNVMAAFFSAH